MVSIHEYGLTRSTHEWGALVRRANGLRRRPQVAYSRVLPSDKVIGSVALYIVHQHGLQDAALCQTPTYYLVTGEANVERHRALDLPVVLWGERDVERGQVAGEVLDLAAADDREDIRDLLHDVRDSDW